MKKNSIFRSLPFKLLVGVIAGVLVGLLLSSTDGNAFSRAILNIVVTLKYILNQIIKHGKSTITAQNIIVFVLTRVNRSIIRMTFYFNSTFCVSF